MVERRLKIAVMAMMLLAGLYAFDLYYGAAGITGYTINSAANIYDCSESDDNIATIAGITTSDLYESGYAEDTCVGDTLLEYFCTDKGPDVRIVNCPTGCFAGACQ